jgi:hypothetical protein
MSTTSTPDDSSPQIQPLHNPAQAAIPLGNNNGQTGFGARALFNKRMAREQYVASPETTGFTPHPIFRTQKFVSPTDKMVTPVSQKLNAAKKKHFDKYAALF